MLHYATLGNNVEAVILLAKEVDIDTPCYLSTTALTTAAGFENVNVLKVLYALGADVTCRDYGGCDVLDNALIGCYGRSYHNHFAQVNCIQLLISNGMRLEKVKKSLKPRITQEMWRFQEGAVQCRDVIVILLGLKKKKTILHKLDRFLVQQELAVAIWTTRQEQEWQKVK